AICPGNQALLQVKGANGGRYEWYASATATAPLAVSADFETPVLEKTTTYYVQQVSNGCAGPRVAVTVTVYSVTANASEAVTIMKGRHTQLSATGGVSYKWEPARGLSDPTVQNPVARPEVTTTYRVTVVTPDGCEVTDEVTIIVTPPVEIVNTFSPNGDGVNDTWIIDHIEKYPDCRLEVFNRWGNKVFSSNGYTVPWDGIANGEVLPVATYYYVLYLKEGEDPISGSVTIIK
ncbi:MAG: gliding motility-associated C-terminal domain-containing protein, partial [Hymenobacteraceae bacterium]|nr:gliding motility-associated C-terminal domain-containing protein [Hymenobacteraceae bacterium]MDX5398019.1 gliding motility-associated C-terminal domain-containing protein [Hymenobacteraceae bacterium]MDX5514090.1 gliding motility-associated C-terminal domain-containing protein [Hymenobacteraceae bacterium]